MTIPYEWGDGLFANPGGRHYIVTTTIDVTESEPPNISLVFGPGRATIRWRGKRFNLPRSRVVGFEVNGGPVAGWRDKWAEFNLTMPGLTP